MSVVHPVHDYENDRRMCLTAVAFLPERAQKEIEATIIQPLREVDEPHYYYASESLHVTIQNVRAVNSPRSFSDDDVVRARDVFRSVVPRSPIVQFTLRGLFELPFSLGVRAYAEQPFLSLVRALRSEMSRRGIPDDKKYASEDVVFGNVTVCRYCHKPNGTFFRLVGRLKRQPIGEIQVAQIALVTTNAVCAPDATTILEEFSLGR